jgi:hypothetical protein
VQGTKTPSQGTKLVSWQPYNSVELWLAAAPSPHSSTVAGTTATLQKGMLDTALATTTMMSGAVQQTSKTVALEPKSNLAQLHLSKAGS